METLIPESPPQVVAGVTLKFPAKLWRIVNNCRTGAIAWESDGASIKVERKKFENQYLKNGLFFKTTHFQSFIRQLNIYGFRKLPSRNQDREHGAVFVYKHDFFMRGHPDFLLDVVRNTSIRKTQRENAIREVEEKHGKLKDLALESQIPTQSTQNIVESHPLLKFPAELVMMNGVPVEPLQKSKTRIATVYLKPRASMSDIQHLSPSKLHDQVADLLTTITDDDVTPFKRRRQSQVITICHPFKDRETGLINNETSSPASHNTSLPLKVHNNVSNQILFVPNPCNKLLVSKIEQENVDSNEDTNNINLDQYSQDSVSSQISLMFGCPIDRDDDDDDLDSAFKQSLSQTCEIEPMECGFGEHGGVDVFDTENLIIDTSISSMGELGYLTPAYYDPETGTVTLMLPSKTPEY